MEEKKSDTNNVMNTIRLIVLGGCLIKDCNKK